MSPVHQSLSVPCLCVACVSVWSWFALQFALHPLFVLHCMVYYKRERGGGGGTTHGRRQWYLAISIVPRMDLK